MSPFKFLGGPVRAIRRLFAQGSSEAKLERMEEREWRRRMILASRRVQHVHLSMEAEFAEMRELKTSWAKAQPAIEGLAELLQASEEMLSAFQKTVAAHDTTLKQQLEILAVGGVSRPRGAEAEMLESASPALELDQYSLAAITVFQDAEQPSEDSELEQDADEEHPTSAFDEAERSDAPDDEGIEFAMLEAPSEQLEWSVDAADDVFAVYELEEDTQPDTQFDTQFDAKPEAKIAAEIGSEIDAEIVAEIDAEPVAEIDAQLDAGPVAEIDTELDAEPEAEIDKELDAEPVAEIAMEIDAESVGEIDAELDSETDAELDAELVPGPEAEPETEIDTEATAEGTDGPQDQLVEAQLEPEAEELQEGEEEEVFAIVEQQESGAEARIVGSEQLDAALQSPAPESWDGDAESVTSCTQQESSHDDSDQALAGALMPLDEDLDMTKNSAELEQQAKALEQVHELQAALASERKRSLDLESELKLAHQLSEERIFELESELAQLEASWAAEQELSLELAETSERLGVQIEELEELVISLELQQDKGDFALSAEEMANHAARIIELEGTDQELRARIAELEPLAQKAAQLEGLQEQLRSMDMQRVQRETRHNEELTDLADHTRQRLQGVQSELESSRIALRESEQERDRVAALALSRQRDLKQAESKLREVQAEQRTMSAAAKSLRDIQSALRREPEQYAPDTSTVFDLMGTGRGEKINLLRPEESAQGGADLQAQTGEDDSSAA